MTYCLGIKLDDGLVFLSDSRTNAGLDQISTYRKMIIYEKPGDRLMVLLSAGNLSISQSVREILQTEKIDNGNLPPITIWNATSMFDAVRVLGSAVRRVHREDGPSLQAAGIDFNAAMIFGGQIKGEAMRPRILTDSGYNTLKYMHELLAVSPPDTHGFAQSDPPPHARLHRAIRLPIGRRSGRDVAQPGSASHWGCGGRRFESSRPDQIYTL